MKATIVLGALIASGSVFAEREPYKLVLFADSASYAQAVAYIATLEGQSPFREMKDVNDLDINVVELDETRMDCRNRASTDGARGISCDNGYLTRMKRREGAQQAMVFTAGGQGQMGSGGNIPVVNTNGIAPGLVQQVATHELLHAYGLCDEYNYDRADARRLCSVVGNAPNRAILGPPTSYTDAAARSAHGGDIPWFNTIPEDRPIVTGDTLGSPPGPQDEEGLFLGGNCSNLPLMGRTARHIYRPYHNSIMRQLNNRPIPEYYAQQVAEKIREQRGQSRRWRLGNGSRQGNHGGLGECQEIQRGQLRPFQPAMRLAREVGSATVRIGGGILSDMWRGITGLFNWLFGR